MKMLEPIKNLKLAAAKGILIAKVVSSHKYFEFEPFETDREANEVLFVLLNPEHIDNFVADVETVAKAAAEYLNSENPEGCAGKDPLEIIAGEFDFDVEVKEDGAVVVDLLSRDILYHTYTSDTRNSDEYRNLFREPAKLVVRVGSWCLEGVDMSVDNRITFKEFTAEQIAFLEQMELLRK